MEVQENFWFRSCDNGMVRGYFWTMLCEGQLPHVKASMQPHLGKILPFLMNAHTHSNAPMHTRGHTRGDCVFTAVTLQPGCLGEF